MAQELPSPKTIDTSKSNTGLDFTTTETTNLSQVIQINASQSLSLKLNPNNYPSWYLQLDTLLAGLDLQGYIDGSFPCPTPTSAAGISTANPEFLRWKRQDKLILHAIIASFTEAIVPNISQCQTAMQAMAKLRAMYASRTHSRVMVLKKRLSNASQGNKSVTEYLNFVKGMADQLAMAQSPVQEDDLVVFILNGFSSDFKGISTAISNRENSITYEELFDKLVDFEIILEAEGQDSSLVVANNVTKGKPNNNNNRQNNARSYGQNTRNNNNRRRNWNNNSRVTCQIVAGMGMMQKTVGNLKLLPHKSLQ